MARGCFNISERNFSMQRLFIWLNQSKLKVLEYFRRKSGPGITRWSRSGPKREKRVIIRINVFRRLHPKNISLDYSRFPLNAIFRTRKNSHYARSALTETDIQQTNSLPQYDILSALVKFSLNPQFMNSHYLNIFGNFWKLTIVENPLEEFTLSGDLV